MTLLAREHPIEGGTETGAGSAGKKNTLGGGLAFAIWGIMSSSERTFEQEVETDGQGSLT
jgi:hypothetical protein